MPRDVLKLIFLIGWLAYLLGVYAPNMRRYRRGRISDARTRVGDMLLDFAAFAGWQVIPLIYVFASWLSFADYELPAWLGWIGAAIFGCALSLLWRAYADLGGNWSPKIEISEGQKLVTQGVYRYIRHPIYAGIWLWAVAHPLLLQNWIAGWMMLALFLPLYAIRVPREEQMMLEHFGEDYRAYVQRTGRLLPRLTRRLASRNG